jgi:hypothetical protein
MRDYGFLRFCTAVSFADRHTKRCLFAEAENSHQKKVEPEKTKYQGWLKGAAY